MMPVEMTQGRVSPSGVAIGQTTDTGMAGSSVLPQGAASPFACELQARLPQAGKGVTANKPNADTANGVPLETELAGGITIFGNPVNDAAVSANVSSQDRGVDINRGHEKADDKNKDRHASSSLPIDMAITAVSTLVFLPPPLPPGQKSPTTGFTNDTSHMSLPQATSVAACGDAPGRAEGQLTGDILPHSGQEPAQPVTGPASNTANDASEHKGMTAGPAGTAAVAVEHVNGGPDGKKLTTVPLTDAGMKPALAPGEGAAPRGAAGMNTFAAVQRMTSVKGKAEGNVVADTYKGISSGIQEQSPMGTKVVNETLSAEGGGEGGSAADAKKKNRDDISSPVSIPAPRSGNETESAKVPPATRDVQARDALHENILSQVRDALVTHGNKDGGMISVRLKPAELGELHINVRVDDHQVRVEIVSENHAVRESLVGNLDSLRETLQKQHLSLDRFDIFTGAHHQSGQGMPQGGGGGARYKAPLPGAREELAAENDKDVAGWWPETGNSMIDLHM